MEEKARVFIGLGSNLGDRAYYLSQALRELNTPRQIIVKKYSSVYETEPVGMKNQPSFLNMVAELESSLPAQELLVRLKGIERSIGRSHNEHWGPREIDLDLLYYGGEIINDNGLQLPHPEIANRRFVLVPMKEIASEFYDPMKRMTITDLLQLCVDTCAVRQVPSHMDLQKKV
jgi:2-amino-4-hydroxy-6-hydroxymethyldihydropteridine diphosphokinase